MSVTSVQEAARSVRAADLYRAVWRWHFYAGLLVIPFLIILSVTGGIYLFRDEVDAFFHSDLVRVEASTTLLEPNRILENATSLYAGQAVKYITPATPEKAAQVIIRQGEQNLRVFVNPYTGAVLGHVPEKGTVAEVTRRLHALAFFGVIANGAMEIAAGWSILLVATGVYLWWPRGRKGGVMRVRGAPGKRVFWRDTHAVTGIFVGFFIVFLAVTGMPWSVVWGAKVNQMANGHNYGYPDGVRVNVPMSQDRLSAHAPTTWSLEQAQIPLSVSAAQNASPISLTQAVRIFEKKGFAAGFTVVFPRGASGVYTASVYPDDLEKQRVAHIDQYSGRSLLDMRWQDYGIIGKGLEWGINVHLGQQYGRANQFILLAACCAIVGLCVSAVVMWWKRRPQGSLGVPPLPRDRTVMFGVLSILIIGGVLFPLVGISMVVMLLLDMSAVKLGWVQA